MDYKDGTPKSNHPCNRGLINDKLCVSFMRDKLEYLNQSAE